MLYSAPMADTVTMPSATAQDAPGGPERRCTASKADNDHRHDPRNMDRQDDGRRPRDRYDGEVNDRTEPARPVVLGPPQVGSVADALALALNPVVGLDGPPSGIG